MNRRLASWVALFDDLDRWRAERRRIRAARLVAKAWRLHPAETDKDRRVQEALAFVAEAIERTRPPPR